MGKRVKLAPSARRHRINREQIAHLISTSAIAFRITATGGDDAALFVGDDAQGQPIEVVAIDEGHRWYVIHAMPLGNRYAQKYRLARRYQQ